ncbi:MAG: T9SS type A sorting domain-containing protein, partial [Bacteroidota bacterium]
ILALTTTEITSGDFTLYPNPANDVVTIECRKNISGELILEVFTISGMKIKEDHFYADDKMQVDISDLLSGMYFIKIYSEGKYSFCQKLFVVR